MIWGKLIFRAAVLGVLFGSVEALPAQEPSDAASRVVTILKQRRDAFVHYDRAQANMLAGDIDKAIAGYTDAVTIDPKFAEAYFERGNAWQVKRKYDKALADYTKATLLNPACAMYWFERGNCWIAKRDYAVGISDLTEAIRLKPDYVDAYFKLADAWQAMGKHDKAVDSAVAYFIHALPCRDKNELDRALAHFARYFGMGQAVAPSGLPVPPVAPVMLGSESLPSGAVGMLGPWEILSADGVAQRHRTRNGKGD